MKKKIAALFAIFVMALLMQLPVTVNAATCTCGRNWPHMQYEHTASWEYDTQGHYRICLSCIYNGHSESCEQVMVVPYEKHVFDTIMGTGADRKQYCKCGYSELVPCSHKNISYRDHSSTECDIYCNDCKTIIGTKAHKFVATNDKIYTDEKIHALICADCKYTRTEEHTFKNTYQKLEIKKTPYALVTYKPMVYHNVKHTCTKCKYSYIEKEKKHTFKSHVCTKCKYKRTLLKQSRITGKRTSSFLKKTTKVKAHLESYIGSNGRTQWRWVKAYSYNTYSCELTVSWPAVKNAYGYVVYEKNRPGKPKVGDYVMNMGTEKDKRLSHYVTTKTTYTWRTSATNKKPTSATVYVAPISKDGFIGYAKKYTIKLK